VCQGDFVYVLNSTGQRMLHLGKAYVIGPSLLSPGKVVLKFGTGHVCSVPENLIERVWHNDWGRLATPCDS
jgi:hypothetical protein